MLSLCGFMWFHCCGNRTCSVITGTGKDGTPSGRWKTHENTLESTAVKVDASQAIGGSYWQRGFSIWIRAPCCNGYPEMALRRWLLTWRAGWGVEVMFGGRTVGVVAVCSEEWGFLHGTFPPRHGLLMLTVNQVLHALPLPEALFGCLSAARRCWAGSLLLRFQQLAVFTSYAPNSHGSFPPVHSERCLGVDDSKQIKIAF